MAMEVANESTCCSCLSTHILQYYSDSLELNGIEYYLVNSHCLTTIYVDTVYIEKTILCTHAELNEPIEVQISAELSIITTIEEDHPLCGLSFSAPGTLSTTAVMDQDHPVSYHLRLHCAIDSDCTVAQSFTFQAFGEVTFIITREGDSNEMDYPATAELKMTIAQSGGSTQAEDHPSSSAMESSAPNDERPAPITSGKRKRSSSSSHSSSSEVDGGVRCTVCMDSLDSILEAGRTLHAVRCGHLMCSQCIPGGEEQALCFRCNQKVVGVRKLHGV